MSLLGQKSFTLAELLIVVIIVSIVAAFAIPRYQGAVDRSYEKDAVINMRSIAAADEIFRAENSIYWPVGIAGPQDTAQINTALRLNIIENQVVYRCMDIFGDVNCWARHPQWIGPDWELVMTSSTNWAISCTGTGGPCPTIP